MFSNRLIFLISPRELCSQWKICLLSLSDADISVFLLSSAAFDAGGWISVRLRTWHGTGSGRAVLSDAHQEYF